MTGMILIRVRLAMFIIVKMMAVYVMGMVSVDLRRGMLKDLGIMVIWLRIRWVLAFRETILISHMDVFIERRICFIPNKLTVSLAWACLDLLESRSNHQCMTPCSKVELWSKEPSTYVLERMVASCKLVATIETCCCKTSCGSQWLILVHNIRFNLKEPLSMVSWLLVVINGGWVSLILVLPLHMYHHSCGKLSWFVLITFVTKRKLSEMGMARESTAAASDTLLKY